MMSKLLELIIACLFGALFLSQPVSAQTRAHPLYGQILDTRTGELRKLTDAALMDTLFPCGAITLLGEVHDNPDHHRMRGALVQAAVSAPRPAGNCGIGAFVFEHIGADQQEPLNNFVATARLHPDRATAAELLRQLDWAKSGWPAAELFEPLFDAVIAAQLPIYASNAERNRTRRLAKDGISALPTERARQLGLDQPLPTGLDNALLDELDASHCGLMPKSAFGNMAVAQRFRDATLAEAALYAATAHGSAVLFAGNGHIRTDRGIPYYVRRHAAGRKVLAVAFVETEDSKLDAAVYVPRDPAGNAATDYVAFAAPAPREDPCEAMRKAMKQ